MKTISSEVVTVKEEYFGVGVVVSVVDVVETDGKNQIFIYRFPGNPLAQLTVGSSHDEQPTLLHSEQDKVRAIELCRNQVPVVKEVTSMGRNPAWPQDQWLDWSVGQDTPHYWSVV